MTLINWFFFTIMLFFNSIEFLSLYLASQPPLMKFESILSESRALSKPKNFRRGLGPLRPPLEERPPGPPSSIWALYARLLLASLAIPPIFSAPGIMSDLHFDIFAEEGPSFK